MQKLHNKSDDPALEQRLDDILEELYGFYSQKIDMSLERVARFLHQLGDSHLSLPPVVHVAGTNGKGSTIAILRSLLENQGLNVHVMTSPHLVHPTERIRLAGDLISTEYLIALLEECLSVNRSEPITFFEMFTAATYLAFSRTPADICLLETGMGGRLDATNVVPDPICTIITTISKDHEKFLGGTLDKIAFEKAGIMKAGVPCVIGHQTDDAKNAEVLRVFHDVSTNLSPNAKLHQIGSGWNSGPKDGQIYFTSEGLDLVLNAPNLLGLHQIYNAGAALEAFTIIEEQLNASFDLSTDKLNKALGAIHWPGRLQRITESDLCSYLNEGDELWLDGGHNDSAGRFLAAQAKQWQDSGAKDLHLIVAMVDRKTPAEFLTPLLPFTKSITLMEIKGEETSYNLKALKKIATDIGFKTVRTAPDIQTALSALKNDNTTPKRILTTGSLYFLGSILSD